MKNLINMSDDCEEQQLLLERFVLVVFELIHVLFDYFMIKKDLNKCYCAKFN